MSIIKTNSHVPYRISSRHGGKRDYRRFLTAPPGGTRGDSVRHRHAQGFGADLEARGVRGRQRVEEQQGVRLELVHCDVTITDKTMYYYVIITGCAMYCDVMITRQQRVKEQLGVCLNMPTVTS